VKKYSFIYPTFTVTNYYHQLVLMNILKKLTLVITVCSANLCNAQSTNSITSDSGLLKNYAYATIGLGLTWDGIWSTFSGSYERMIFEPKKKGLSSVWLRSALSVSKFDSYSDGIDFTDIIVGISGLTGLNNRHFEWSVGLLVGYDFSYYKNELENFSTYRIINKSDYFVVLPAIALGYRFQPPGGKIIYRTGIAFPELAYFSLGVCF